MVEIGIVIDLWGLNDITSFWVKDPVLGERNFTDHMLTYRAVRRRNQMGTFSIGLFDINDDEKEWIKEGNIIKLFSENKLFMKGRIGSLGLESYNHAHIEGDSIETKGKDDVTFRNDFKYVQVATNTIINNLASGLFQVGTNVNFGLVDARFEYENKLAAIMLLATNTDSEWRIRNIVDDGYETDYLDFGPNLGSTSSVYNFDTTGSNLNTMFTIKERNKEYVINKIIVLGAGDGVNQLTSTNYHATTNRTFLNGGDTFLALDLNSSDNSCTVYSTSGFPSSGTIRIDNEQMTYSGKTSISFTGLVRAVNSTSASSHFTNSGVMGYTSLTVDSTTLFPSSGSVRIGNEVVAYSGITATTFTGITRGSSSTTPYAHIDNIEVYDNQYTATIDGSQMGSSIKKNGVLISQFINRTIIDQNTLDLVAQWIIQDRQTVIEKITIVPTDFKNVLNSVDVLDNVTITDTETGLSGTYQVVGMALQMSGTESLEIEISTIGTSFLDITGGSVRQTQNLGQYMQGATNVDSNSIVEDMTDEYGNATNTTATGATDLFFNISEDAKQINAVKLSYRLQVGTNAYSATLLKILTTNNAEGAITWTDRTVAIETVLGRSLNADANTSETDIDLTSYFSATGWKGARIVANGNARVFASITQKIYIHS